MLQDFRRSADDIRKMDVEAREYLKSLANEFMSREEEREHTEEESIPFHWQR
jgi:Na+/phosphate symporter